MNELRRRDSQSVSQQSQSQGICGYCGMQLNAFYYFCTSCGTPYKDVETLITAASPPIVTEGEMIQMKAPAAMPLFWTYFSIIVFGSIFSQFFFKEESPADAMFFLMILLLITTCIFSAIYWRSLITQFKHVGFDRPHAWVGLLILVPALAVNFLISVQLTKALGMDEETSFLEKLRGDGLSEATLVVAFCLFPAITEEIAFRGLLQHWLQLAIKPMHAIVLSSFLFSAMHFNVFSFVYLFGIGFLLGWTKWKTRSLYPSMLIHFLHNFIVIKFFYG